MVSDLLRIMPPLKMMVQRKIESPWKIAVLMPLTLYPPLAPVPCHPQHPDSEING
jgi:hypothetical protein